MTARPRTREYFPRMKARGVRRRYRLRRELDATTILMLQRVGIDLPALREVLGGMSDAIRLAQREIAFGFAGFESIVPADSGFEFGPMIDSGFVISLPFAPFPLIAQAPPYPIVEQDLSGHVFDDAFDPEPESCSLCDDHVHDITNTACVCCMVNAPDPASVRRPPADLLTLQCMAAAHDRCEGDFCECACHDTTEGD